jgi:hypothetical protein
MDELLQLLWNQNTTSGRTIILLIVVLGGFGGLCALRHWGRYRGTERHWLITVRDRLRRAQEARHAPGAPAEMIDGADIPVMVEEPRPPETTPIIDLHELTEGVPRDTLIGDRLRTIIRMKQARVRVNVDALQQSSVSKESAKWTLSFPAYVVSLVMMLGLLGTFIGLSLMVVDIQQSLPGSGAHATTTQWAASVSSLGRILAGKKTAFSATLAGLFFSIIVSLLNFALARAQSDFYDRLERFTAEDLLPATLPAFDDETPWEKLTTQLGDSFEHLQMVASEQTRSAEQLLAVEKTFATVIENIESITQRAATAPLQGMAGEISSVIGQLTEVNGALIALTERLPQIVNAFRQTHQATLGEISSAMSAHQAGIERVWRAVQSHQGERRLGNLGVAAAGAAAMLILFFVISKFI